jgi:hypothetical protein
MKRLACVAAALGALALPGTLAATTLEKLTLDEMVAKSTEIVRGKVVGISAASRGAILYTQARVQVVERLKGAPAPTVDVAVPGGTLNGFRQSFSGAPQLAVGAEHVFFLWRGPSGVAQIIGLSQGLMDVKIDATGKSVVSRGAAQATVVDPATRQPVVDTSLEMSMDQLRDFVRRRVAE